MKMFIEGRIFGFVFIVIMICITIFMFNKSKTWLPTVRKIAGLEAISEAIGRAVEMGRPVHFAGGSGGQGSSLSSPLGPQILAGMTVLGKMARECAKMNCRLIVSIGQQDVVAVATEIVKDSFIAENQPTLFNPQDIMYYPEQGYSYQLGILGMINTEKPAANILIGPLLGHEITFVEEGFRMGAIQIAGTGRLIQIPFMAVVCDYILIGEEIYAAGAYLSEDPEQLSSLVTADIIKVFGVFLVLIGMILSIFNNNILVGLLKS